MRRHPLKPAPLALAFCVLGLTLAASCDTEAPAPRVLPRELAAVPNPFGPDDPAWSPQPHRDKPYAIVSGGDRLYVSLRGTETEPGRHVAIVDASSLEVLDRVEVGPSPGAMALHPDGRHLLVTGRFASYVSIVDVERARVVGEVEVPFYTEGIAISADGRSAWLTNRWKDSLLRWALNTDDGALEVEPLDHLRGAADPVGIPLMDNPLRVIATSTPNHVLVTSESSLSLSLVDTEAGRVIAEHRPNAPVTDAVVVGEHVYLLHTGSGAGHPPVSGHDGDMDGSAGDGTANVTFQDVQNEIDVLDLADLRRRHRYTSDTICCKDYRDVDPERPDVGLSLHPIDSWPPSRVAFMPDPETWIVAGSMPERVLAFRREDSSPALAVIFGGSSQVQTFDIDPEDGSLTARETAETGLYETGFGARDGVVLDDHRLLVVDHLGETLSELDLWAAPGPPARQVVVGDVAGGAYPATDAELGEAFNTVTARFTTDGDQTCVHCHRDGTPIAKAVSMPLLETPEWGVRAVMSYRGAYDTRPWFVEASMFEHNFFPVINEFTRRENFCCEQSDVRVWSAYPDRASCLEAPEAEGCDHVLSCLDNPPPECAERGYGGQELTRERHFRAAARLVLGRDESFGDALYTERLGADGEIERRPIALGFDGLTRALGLFLMARPRLLPNPNAALPSRSVRVGAAIYASSEAGCTSCHPLPVGATAEATVATEAPGPLSFPYLVTPMREPTTGLDVDRVNPAFLGTFPQTTQTDGGLRVGVTSLRGLWDRGVFLHHGQARSLREAVANPGHPALANGERGFNERDGQPDTHGSTSHLSPEDLEALLAFLRTL